MKDLREVYEKLAKLHDPMHVRLAYVGSEYPDMYEEKTLLALANIMKECYNGSTLDKYKFQGIEYALKWFMEKKK
jgi:hypothetical protein